MRSATTKMPVAAHAVVYTVSTAVRGSTSKPTTPVATMPQYIA